MDTDKKNPITEPADRSCDSKIWQGECQHDDFTEQGDKFLCNTCGKVGSLDHEMHHEHFPHNVGDYTKLY